jgi:hypothetical protein
MTAFISFPIGNSVSRNVRQHLTGAEFATANITLVDAQGNNPTTSGFTNPGTGSDLVHNGTSEGSGSFEFRATGSGGSVDSNSYLWNAYNPATAVPWPLATLHGLYKAIITDRGGAPIPLSNTRYWNKPTYPTCGSVETSIANLNTAIGAASSGTVVCLQDGTYANATITIGANDDGVIVAAQTKNGVNLSGDSKIVIATGGDTVGVFGFHFTGPNNANRLIEVNGNDALIAYNRSSITARAGGDITANTNLFHSEGQRNRFAYNTVSDYRGAGRAFHVANNADRYSRIDHNEVLNVYNDSTTNPDNEVVQIGQTGYGNKNFSLVDNNYVYRWQNKNGGLPGSTEQEMFTFKSDANFAIQNVFLECNGNINLRHSGFSAVYGNFWIANGFSRAGGVGITGEGHLIAMNYGENGNSSGHNTRAFIRLNGGDNIDSDYYAAKNAEISFNTTYNWREPITVQNQTGTPAFAVSGTKFYNTAIDKNSTDNAYTQFNNPTATGTTWHSDSWEPTVGITGTGLTAETPALTLVNGVRIPTASGNLDGTGQSGFSELILYDILGNTVGGSLDRGAFQSTPSINPWQAIINKAGQAQ